jgi:hypothetical protein
VPLLAWSDAVAPVVFIGETPPGQRSTDNSRLRSAAITSAAKLGGRLCWGPAAPSPWERLPAASLLPSCSCRSRRGQGGLRAQRRSDGRNWTPSPWPRAEREHRSLVLAPRKAAQKSGHRAREDSPPSETGEARWRVRRTAPEESTPEAVAAQNGRHLARIVTSTRQADPRRWIVAATGREDGHHGVSRSI